MTSQQAGTEPQIRPGHVSEYSADYPKQLIKTAVSGPCGAAWTDFCRRLERVGHLMLSMDGVETPNDEAETLRYLTGELRAALEWEVQNADPDFPNVFREDECGSGPAGPNMDNSYWRARIDPKSTYRLTLDTRTIFDGVIGATDKHLFNYGDRSLSTFSVGGDGQLEILISTEEQPGNWLRMTPEATLLGIRIYYYDWDRHIPPRVQIERLGSAGQTPALPDPGTMVRRLDAAMSLLEDRPFRWTPLLNAMMDVVEDNQIAKVAVPDAAGPIQYGTGRYRLAEQEALIVEFSPPKARYWSFNVYTVPWMSLIDPLNSVTGLNGQQAATDPDGVVRLVIAHRDPGIPNWLSTGGFPVGTCWYRWIWSEDHPSVRTRVVPFDQVRTFLHTTTPTVTPEQRAEQISRRRRHLTTRVRY